MQTLLRLLFPLKLEVKSDCCFWDQIFLLQMSHNKLVESILQNSGWCDDQSVPCSPSQNPGIRAATSLSSCFLKSKILSLSSLPQFTVKIMNTILRAFKTAESVNTFGIFLCEFYFPVLYINIFMWMLLAVLRGRQITYWNTGAAVQHKQAAIFQVLPKSPLLNDFSTLILSVTLWVLGGLYSLFPEIQLAGS